MTVEVCPYCRAAIGMDEGATVCEGCSARHHAECYSENGGCTIFGCRCAPAEEPKLSVSVPELAKVECAAPINSSTQSGPVAPPPPARAEFSSPQQQPAGFSSTAVPTVLNLFPQQTMPTTAEPSAGAVLIGQPKNRTTFIVLGALLGAFGAHNFYAGYHKRALMQLAITLATFGFGTPMSWIWAIIDICTINRDKRGIQFEY
jgi:TM2 domain-containing membrane protein YozV